MTFYLTTKDFAVTGEEFNLEYDPELDMLRTVAEPACLDNYYKSPDYISHTDAQTTFQDKAYHLIKHLSLRRKMSWIRKFFPDPGSLLDIGAGTGDFVSIALKDGWTASGIEPNAIAREKARSKGVRLEENMDQYSERTFKVISLWHVLEHIPHPQEYIRLLTSKLAPGGLLFIAVPNFRSYDAHHYGKFWAAYDVPRHLSHFSRNAIHRLFLDIGFKIIDSKPMSFDSYYIALLSEKYKTGNRNYLKAFLIGLISNVRAWRTKEYSSILYILRAEGNLNGA